MLRSSANERIADICHVYATDWKWPTAVDAEETGLADLSRISIDTTQP
jgi:hypothetical protein